MTITFACLFLDLAEIFPQGSVKYRTDKSFTGSFSFLLLSGYSSVHLFYPLWLPFSPHVLCIFVSISFSGPAAILLINSSTSSTFTAERDRQGERDEESRLLIPSKALRERERTALKHQQNVVALGYVAVRCLLSERCLLLMSGVNKNKLRNQRRKKKQMVLHDSSILLHNHFFLSINHFANNVVQFSEHLFFTSIAGTEMTWKSMTNWNN